MTLNYTESIALETIKYNNALSLQTFWFESITKIILFIFVAALIFAFFYWSNRVGEGKRIIDGQATERYIITPMHVIFGYFLKLWAFVFVIFEFIIILTLGGRIELMSLFMTFIFLIVVLMLSGIFFTFYFGIRNMSLIIGYDKHLIHKAKKMKGRAR